MKRVCYIVANTPPPSLGWHTRARGIRAEQLAAHARMWFDEVRYVLFLERFNALRAERGFAILAGARDDTTLISVDAFEPFADRIEPATFVFTQIDFAEQAEYAAERHTIVYDILSLSELTLKQTGATESELHHFRVQHQKMLRLASRTIVNGQKSAQWLADDLRGVDVRIAPFAPAPSLLPERERTHLLFGGPLPRWTDVTPLFRAMSGYLASNCVPTIMLAPAGQNEDANALEYSALWLMGHVTAMWNLSACNDAEVLARSFGYVDWAPLTMARAYSTSLRTLQAVAAGVPVLHQRDTALDFLWDRFPGERLDHPITADDVARFVERAKAGHYRDAVAAARNVLLTCRNDPAPLADLRACA